MHVRPVPLFRSPHGVVSLLSGRTLSQRFALTSFVAFLLTGVVFAVILSQAVQGIALGEARQDAYDDLHARLLHRVKVHELMRGWMTPSEYRVFDAFVQNVILTHRTMRVKVWDRTGKVIYSDDRRIVGRTFPIGDELSEAFRGKTASEVSDLSKSENRDDRRYGKLLEVYLPIQYTRRGQVYGAFEVYRSFAPVEREISLLQQTGYEVLGGGFVILYLLVFSVVHRGSNTIVRQQRRLLKQALHDDLTDLPNRTYFHDQVQAAVENSLRTGSTFALLLMDMDRFKEVNDTFGHHWGDLLLQQFGIRLGAAVREIDTVGRLGGDEFAILLAGASEPIAVSAARRISGSLDQPFDIQGQLLQVGVSIGIALYPEHGSDATALLQRADVAMYHAKRTDTGYAIYSPEQDEYSPDRLTLIAELRQAIEHDDLRLHYQPKLGTKSDRIDGVEALVRWQHPERGLIPPDQFIPLAEHTGLIRQLTGWVLDTALRQCQEWQERGFDLGVAVNLSARSLHDARLVETIEHSLTTWGVPARSLTVELTESALMTDPARGMEVLTTLHTMGVKVAVDDFGTGYSSLAYLKRLPVDEIKIDKSFVENLATDRDDCFIVRSVVDLGHSLGLRVVAEGVETQQSLRLLTLMGCDLVQGYHVSRPLPATNLVSWLEAPRTRHAT